ncbi:MAG: DNA mismatch repair endonuclease MutL [Planctomycetes bacterium]|nr:DNA mismatch repair endonuclease MutL [Planctomycetota bacterium]
MPIRLLPRQLVDQIAAGEVVERPASVVKELVENAIDAGAQRIEVSVEGGGVDRIVVADDGGGIAADELPLAIASHATSKISSSDDLAAIGTMGFRGEALASIASVSRLSITSRVSGSDAGARIEVDGGVASEVRPAGCPVGTVVEVRQLFHNVPARRKFLRTAGTELGRIEEVLESIALCRPDVAFRLVADGKTRVDLPATTDARRRVLAVLGESIAEGLLEVTADTVLEGGAPITLWGLVGRPSLARGSGRALRFALNGRAVLDRTLAHAVKEAFRGLVDPGRTPIAFVAVEMDPSLVDVNVHPAKTEVRFRQPNFVHQCVMRAVRDALRAADLVPSFTLMPHAHSVGPTNHAFPASTATPTDFSSFAALAVDRALHATPPVALVSAAPETLHGNRTARRVMQVHGSYLVVEDAEGILVVDQHALHERGMFEELKARIAASPLESQRMLVPVAIETDPRAVEAIADAGPLLQRLGIELGAVGPRAVLVHAYPTFLLGRGVEPTAFVPGLLAQIAEDGHADFESALHSVLDMMACKASVKAGDRLSPTEIDALLDLRDRIERGTACPHGRPTALRITMRDLERNFGRS